MQHRHTFSTQKHSHLASIRAAQQVARPSYLWFPTCAALSPLDYCLCVPLPGTLFLDAPSLHRVNSYPSLGLGIPSILPNLGALPCYMASLTIFQPVFDKFGDETFTCAW